MSPDSLKAKERKARLQYMSYRDMLTTLYNRNRYIQVLEGMQAKTVIKTGVAYIDINGLKRVNDLYGHEAGDRLIINTARSMLAILPENAYRLLPSLSRLSYTSLPAPDVLSAVPDYIPDVAHCYALSALPGCYCLFHRTNASGLF